MISEAIAAIDRTLMGLGIEQDGVLLLPAEVQCLVDKFHGTVADELREDFAGGRIPVEVWRDANIALIEEYGRYRFRTQLERKLVRLMEAV